VFEASVSLCGWAKIKPFFCQQILSGVFSELLAQAVRERQFRMRQQFFLMSKGENQHAFRFR
jgi:hypothetical protein